MNTNNAHSVFVTLGASNHSDTDREMNDYYATDPLAMELLLKLEQFSHDVWECSCGAGHLSKVLEEHGYNVTSTDLVYRGYGTGGVDFLKSNKTFDGDIVTNPPYKYAKEFVQHAIESITDGHKVAMFLRLQFLEGKSRRTLFDKYPPKTVYVASGRINCAMGGDFENHKGGAQAYAWFIWEKGYTDSTTIKWFN